MTLAHEKFTVQIKFKDYIGTISFAFPPCSHVSLELLKIMADQLLALYNPAVLAPNSAASTIKNGSIH